MGKGNKILAVLLAFVMMISIAPSSVQAKTIAGHTVFSKKQVENRISKIQDYYYNRNEQLKIRNQKISLPSGEDCNVSYYIHGKDLMFGYGVSGKTEYRMYFYENQLIRLLVDEPGKKRKTYQQLYKKLKNTAYDDNLNLYMRLENYGRKQMESAASKSKKVVTGQPVLITKVSGNYIVYHKLSCYGPDGAIWSISKKTYKAKINTKTAVLDGSANPNGYEKKNINWLKNCVSGTYIGYAVKLSGKGSVVSKIEGLYFA